MIYHILPKALWQVQTLQWEYRNATLESEGFIHCTGDQGLLAGVANRFYRAEPGEWVILCIDEACVASEVRWEVADGTLFPHIYGSLNLNAVAAIIDFPRTSEGEFILPSEWASPNFPTKSSVPRKSVL